MGPVGSGDQRASTGLLNFVRKGSFLAGRSNDLSEMSQ